MNVVSNKRKSGALRDGMKVLWNQHPIAIWATILVLVLSSLGTAIGAYQQQLHLYDVLACIGGTLAMGYTTYCMTQIFTDKIRRDIMLVKKNYLIWVILMIVVMPLIFARYVLLTDLPNSFLMSENSIDYMLDTPDSGSRLHSMIWPIIIHYIDPGSQYMASSAGRIVAFMLTIIGMLLFDGLLVSSIISWIERQKEQWKFGDIRYALKSLPKGRYAVVIGANEMAASVIKGLLQSPSHSDKAMGYMPQRENDYVILQTCSEVPDVREMLSAYLSEDEMDRVICYNALRHSEKEIAQLYVGYATEIYILGESTIGKDAENAHDALNMRCLNLIARELMRHKAQQGDAYEKKPCRVMFDYQTTYSVFQFSDIPSDVQETMVFVPFNLYDAWARQVLVEHSAVHYGKTIHYTPLDGYEGIAADDDKRVHLVIVGMSKMGVAMGVQALHHAHYVNYAKHRTRITFIDTNVEKEMAFFKGRYSTLFELMRHRYVDANKSTDVAWVDPMAAANNPWAHLSDNGKNFIDVEVEFVKGELESDGVRDYLRQVASDKQSKLTIAICLDVTNRALAASLYMPLEVYQSAQLQDIWVYQRRVVDIVANLTDKHVASTSVRYKKLRPFGMLYSEYHDTQSTYLKAVLVNTAYDVLYNDVPWPENIADTTDAGWQKACKSWEKLMVAKKWSNRFFADSMYQKIRSIYRPGALMDWMQKNSALMDEHAYNEQLRSLAVVGGYHDAMYSNAGVQHLLEEAISKHEEELAVSEHNRWNMEQLLMGYSPCKHEEDALLTLYVRNNQASEQHATKNMLKRSAAKVHPNICAYEHLSDIDPQAKSYDIQLIYAIPRILMLVDGHGLCQYETK
jgi:hypothetical protein